MKITIELETIDELRELMSVNVKDDSGTALDRFLQEIHKNEPVPVPSVFDTGLIMDARPKGAIAKHSGDTVKHCICCGTPYQGRNKSEYCSGKCYQRNYKKVMLAKKAKPDPTQEEVDKLLDKCRKDSRPAPVRPEHHHLSHSA